MDTNIIDYKKERANYYKVLLGLLLLTAVTFIQPHLFMTESTFLAQMLIAVVKAWLIIMFYMHLKGERLITWMAGFSLFIVLTFFSIVIGVDVQKFQYTDENYITQPNPVVASATAAH
ncbi:MAG: cytochrome C oxidase subunit IV family protein [Sulfurovum sp.]|nr:cytochrome C oxidase subunit IV family protein [Sulfurovum sp.]